MKFLYMFLFLLSACSISTFEYKENETINWVSYSDKEFTNLNKQHKHAVILFNGDKFSENERETLGHPNVVHIINNMFIPVVIETNEQVPPRLVIMNVKSNKVIFEMEEIPGPGELLSLLHLSRKYGSSYERF